MEKREIIYLEFEVDKLTNSIENAISGEVFNTLIRELTPSEFKLIKRNDWVFNWQNEIKSINKQVFILTTSSNPLIIQGIISLTDQ